MIPIQYSWKGAEWKDLRNYPSDYVDYELNKLNILYAGEYKFRINK